MIVAKFIMTKPRVYGKIRAEQNDCSALFSMSNKNQIEPKGAHRKMMKNEMRSPDYKQNTRRRGTRSAPMATHIPVGRKRTTKKQVQGQLSLFDTGAKGTELINPATIPLRVEMAQKYVNPDWEELLNNNTGLVYDVLPEIKGVNANNREDILQAGFFGLMNAARRFDPGRGFQFSSYAVPSIRNNMIKEVHKQYGKLDTVSMDELLDEKNRIASEIIESEAYAPTHMQETDEIIEMLMEIAQTQRRSKDKKGVIALAMRLQGYDAGYIAQQTKVKKESYNAMVSAGRRALRNHPQLVNYMSMLKDEVVKDIIADLLGIQFPVCYARNTVFDVPTDGTSAREYLEVLVSVIEREDVSDLLLHEVPIGETVYLIDADNGCTSTFEMGMNGIEVQKVRKTNWRPLRRSA